MSCLRRFLSCRHLFDLAARRLTALILFCLVARPAEALPRAKQRWIEIDTTHFNLISNASEQKTRSIATDLENFMAVLEGLIGHELKSPLPSTVYVFKNDSAFKTYKPLWEGKPANVAGYFQKRVDGNVIAVNGDQRLEAVGVLYHELMHYVMSSNYLPVPLWVSEGLAELYSTFEVGKEQVYVGKPVASHVFWLRDRSLIPLAEFFAIDTSSPGYNEGNRQGSFYAQSWLLIHYLLLSTDEQRRTHLFEFLDLGRRGVSVEEAFRRSFGIAYRDLERELQKYARLGKFYYQSLPPARDVGPVSPPRLLARHEVLCQLGELLAAQPGRESEAEEHFRAGLESDSKAGLCHLGMGRVMEAKQQLRQAAVHFQQATKHAPESFAAWYRWALLRLEDKDALPEDEPTLRALRRSVELEPEFAPAWAALSYAYTFSGDIDDEAIKAGERAQALSPAQPEIAHNLLYLYIQAGRREAAEALFQRFFAHHDEPEVVRNAKLALLQLDIQEAEALLEAEKIEEAIAVLERVQIAGAGVPELVWVNSQLREARRFLEEKHQVDRYNRAVDFLNRGDREAARILLEEIAGEEPSGALGEAVETTLKQVLESLARGGP